MGCVNKYMLQRTGLQVLAVTRRNHTAEEEPDFRWAVGAVTEWTQRYERATNMRTWEVQ